MSYKIQIKPFRQKPDYCGPGTLKMVLSFLDIDKSEEELAALTQAIYAPDEYRVSGTEHEGMIAAAKTLGLNVFTKEEGTIDNLIYFIEQKHLPVIVGWFDRDDDHYCVAVEVTNTEVVLADSSSEGPERRIPRELFPRIWFDFVGPGSHKVSWGWLMVISKDKIASP